MKYGIQYELNKWKLVKVAKFLWFFISFLIPAAGYRMVQPNVTWGVQTAAAAAVPGMPNGSAGQPQMMYTAAMPQYQTQ